MPDRNNQLPLDIELPLLRQIRTALSDAPAAEWRMVEIDEAVRNGHPEAPEFLCVSCTAPNRLNIGICDTNAQYRLVPDAWFKRDSYGRHGHIPELLKALAKCAKLEPYDKKEHPSGFKLDAYTTGLSTENPRLMNVCSLFFPEASRDRLRQEADRLITAVEEMPSPRSVAVESYGSTTNYRWDPPAR